MKITIKKFIILCIIIIIALDMMRSITLFLGSNKHTTENFSELKHPTEGGQLIKRLEESAHDDISYNLQ